MRASGRTTRIADDAIQTLFTTGKIVVMARENPGAADRIDTRHVITDHYFTIQAARALYRTIKNRLVLEHRLVSFNFNDNKLTITLKHG